MNNSDFIPFHVPSIGDQEIAEVTDCLRSGWLTTGPRTAQFEKEFREYVNAPCALAVNSGTAALHLALAGLGIGPGDEVITTALTFCSTVNVIIQVGAKPVLADIGPDLNIDPDSVKARLNPNTKAILAVHLGGLPCRLDEIRSMAKANGCFVIEDAAHATGAQYRGVPIGGGDPAMNKASNAVAFSFYATKNLTTGEGGMVTTPDGELLERMRILCLHGISKDAWNRYSKEGSWYYEVVECGYKYNLTDLQSAIGIPQLRKQEEFLAARTQVAQDYNESFADVPELELPPDDLLNRHAWHLYALRLRLDRLAIDRGEFIAALNRRGIGSSVHFIPIPLHPFFKRFLSDPRNHCPKALETYPRLVSLPVYPDLGSASIQRVVAGVKDIIHETRKRTFMPVCT